MNDPWTAPGTMSAGPILPQELPAAAPFTPPSGPWHPTGPAQQTPPYPAQPEGSHPAAFAPSAQQGGSFPTGLQVLTIGVSVLKALPLVFFALVLLFIASTGSDIESATPDFDIVPSSFWGIVALFAIILLALTSTLVLQVWAAATSRVWTLVTVSGFMVALDLTSVISEVSGEETGAVSLTLGGLLVIAQIAICVWAMTSRKSNSPS